jgi:enamine deaminase RidA (YjgF/YER057c/UK114 family)
MARQLISSGSQFEHDIGYSRAVVDGDWIFVSGTTGFNYQTVWQPLSHWLDSRPVRWQGLGHAPTSQDLKVG